jgi:nucleotide-binding universal stress UspA family protein
MSRPVLLCFDGSDGARHAITAAGALLGGGPAVVACVWEPLGEFSRGNPWGAFVSALGRPAQEMDEIAAEVASDIADDGAAAARDAGFDPITTRAERREDGLDETLLRVADEVDARAIVAGSRGLGLGRALLLGSVSSGLVHHARRPVVIVPRPGGDATQ